MLEASTQHQASIQEVQEARSQTLKGKCRSCNDKEQVNLPERSIALAGRYSNSCSVDRKHHPRLHHTDSHRLIRSKAIYLTAS